MNERVKKIVVVILFLGSVIGIAFTLYFAFFRAAPPEATVEPDEQTNDGSFPTSGTGGPRPTDTTPPTTTGELPSATASGGLTETTTLTTGAISDLALGSNGSSANFYNPADGRFYTIDANGNVVTLSDKTFPEATDVSWNKDADTAVIEFPDGSNVVYDFATETQVTLPKHWEEFSFSPVSDEIAAKSMGLDPDNRWIVVSNENGSQVETIQALGDNADKVQVNWSPNNQVLAFADTADSPGGGLDRKMILPLGMNQENFPGLVVEGLDFTPLWSPNGQKLLYSVVGEYSDNKPLLWTVDATSGTMGQNRHSIGLNTWADKCTYASDTTIYCAVPQGLNANMGLQRSLAANLPDYLYKIDLSTGRSSLVAIPEQNTTMESLSVTKDGSVLYYANRSTGRLESIRLR